MSTAHSLQPWLIEHRRHLHQQPELSFHEVQTSAYLRAQVEALGLQPVMVSLDRHGFYADLIAPKNPTQFVALRADMDALPIQEETGLPFPSRTPNVGHLCGHDAHSSMLLGAVRVLLAKREELPFSVRFLFQHAEEVPPGGAIDFVKAGVLEPVVAAFGLHVSPRHEIGTLATKVGPVMAAANLLKIHVKGRGGHAARPHDCADPVAAAAAIVLAVQQVVSRRCDPLDPFVISICTVHAGIAHNVIPETVEMSGTMRAFSDKGMDAMIAALNEIVPHTAKAWRCEATAEIDGGYPVVNNDAAATAALTKATESVLGAGSVLDMAPVMGGEDFAYYGQKVPAAFGFIGAAPPGRPYYPLHHPMFYPDEEVLWRGASVLAAAPFAWAGTL